MYVVAASTAHHHLVTGSNLSHGANYFGGLFVSGHSVSEGFCPGWLFDWGTFVLMAFIRGLFVGG